MGETAIAFEVNGRQHSLTVEDRRTLAEVLPEELRLTGTHLACEHGVCGACTVLLDREAVRSCLLFAAQVDGGEVTTIEGRVPERGAWSPIHQAFVDHHDLQCGFCTSGVIVSLTAFLRDHPHPSDQQILEGLSGNLCRCSYQGILAALRAVVS